MGCEICGRSSCTRSFHSLEEQNNFDSSADRIKDYMRNDLKYKINRLNTISNYGDNDDNDEYVKLSDVIDIIDNYS